MAVRAVLRGTGAARLVVFLGLLAVAWRPLHAQDPTRLPVVVVNAVPDAPGPRKMVGVVRDTFAIPIDSVEISIVKLRRRAFTKTDGTFLFTDIKPGKYEVRARKIGYAPQLAEFTVDDSGGTGGFKLLPLTQVLRPVVTTVGRGGISGVVGDTAFNALVGTEIRVVGKGRIATTDSTGQFYIPIEAGSYLLRFKQPGFAERLVSVIVPKDSGERVRVTLAPPAKPLSNREVHNVDDMAERAMNRSNTNSRVFTRAELQQMKIEWVYDAVEMGYRQVYSGRDGTLDKDCVAMVNGGPDYTEIGKLTVDDIESVEIYNVGQSRQPTNRQAGKPFGGYQRFGTAQELVPITNTDRAAWANYTKKCTTVYVWLR
jgi:hypothetical protein